MGKMKDTICFDVYEKQQQLIDDGCRCLIFHPTDPEYLAEIRNSMVTGDAFQTALAIAQLSTCPSREGKN